MADEPPPANKLIVDGSTILKMADRPMINLYAAPPPPPPPPHSIRAHPPFTKSSAGRQSNTTSSLFQVASPPTNTAEHSQKLDRGISLRRATWHTTWGHCAWDFSRWQMLELKFEATCSGHAQNVMSNLKVGDRHRWFFRFLLQKLTGKRLS